MQRHRNDPRAETQRLTPHHLRQQILNLARHIRLPFQQQHRLAQRTFIDPSRPRSRKHRLLTPAASLLVRRAALQTNPFLIRENPCSLPTRLTRNSESSLLDTASADYADLWIHDRENRIVNQIASTREVHTLIKTASPNRGGRKLSQKLKTKLNLRRRPTTRAPLSPGSARSVAPTAPRRDVSPALLHHSEHTFHN